MRTLLRLISRSSGPTRAAAAIFFFSAGLLGSMPLWKTTSTLWKARDVEGDGVTPPIVAERAVAAGGRTVGGTLNASS